MKKVGINPRLAKKALLLVGLIVAILAVAPYLQTGRFGFINLDDGDYVFMHPRVPQGLSLSNWEWAWTTVGYAANWHPLTWLSLMLDVELFGVENVGAMHLHNVILHGVNAVLLFSLLLHLLRLIGRRAGCDQPPQGMARWERGAIFAAAVTAMLWAVHPLRAEVVAWISERKELLSVLWGLVTIRLYGQQLDERTANKAVWYGLSLLAYGLALAAKPVTVGVPAILLALELAWGTRNKWQRVIPFALLAAAGCVVTILAQQEAMAPVKEVVLSTRLMNALAALGVYLRQTVAPYGLGVFYPVSHAITWHAVTLGAILVLASAACGVGLLRSLVRGHAEAGRASTGFALAVLVVAWCLVGLLPMLGIVQVGSQAHADRYTYWVGCGFSVAVAYGVCRLLLWAESVSRQLQTVVACGLMSILCVYAILGWRQASRWKDTITLFRHSYETGGKNAWAAYGLAEQYARAGEMEKAEALYRHSVKTSPNDENLGGLAIFLAIVSEGAQFDEPFAFAQQSLQRNPDSIPGNEAMGLIALRMQVWDKAEEHLRRALKIPTRNAAVWEWLAIACFHQKKFADARTAIEQALRLEPANPQYRSMLEQMITSTKAAPGPRANIGDGK